MKNKYTVYLAGPISDCSYDGATDWRQYADDILREDGLIGMSPMRGKDFLKGTEKLHKFGYPEKAIATESAIMQRDFSDVKRCDAVLINLENAKVHSLGTIMELAWCFALQKPVVVVMEKGNIHEHCMVNEAAKCRVHTLDEGLMALKTLLLPY